MKEVTVTVEGTTYRGFFNKKWDKKFIAQKFWIYLKRTGHKYLPLKDVKRALTVRTITEGKIVNLNNQS
jgi:hypothetical protein